MCNLLNRTSLGRVVMGDSTLTMTNGRKKTGNSRKQQDTPWNEGLGTGAHMSFFALLACEGQFRIQMYKPKYLLNLEVRQ